MNNMKGKIFNTQEVQAIISKQKIMFREVVKKPPHEIIEDCIYKGQVIKDDSKKLKGFVAYFQKPKHKWLDENKMTGVMVKCPYQVGQKIFCKESFWVNKKSQKFCWYDNGIFECGDSVVKKPAQHMKQKESRLTLLIKKIRVERLQDISEQDARKEGVIDGGCGNCGESEFVCKCLNKQPLPREDFIFNWNSTHKKLEEGFEANPFVWVVNFEVVK